MKVLQAYIFFSIKFAGGTSDLMFKLCKALEKTNVKNTVLCGSYNFDKSLSKKLEKTNFKVCKSYFDSMGFSITPGYISFLYKEMKSFDVIHMHVYRTFQNIVLYIFCKIFKKDYIMDAHGSVPYFTNKRLLKKIFDLIIGKKILRDAKYLVAETEVGKKEYLDLDSSLDEKKIKIISPPFDTDEFIRKFSKNRFRNKFSIPEDAKIISFLGRIHYIKGVDFLIKGFANLIKNSDKNYILCLIGSDDGFLDKTNELIKKLNIEEHVRYIGFLSGDEKNDALYDSDLVVQLSRLEQGAWAPIEAVLCGTPILVTKNTGSGEDIKRLDAGALVEFDDVVGFTNIVNEIFNNYDYWASKTVNAKEYIIKNLSFNARVKEYLDLYK